jgi:hypothetical protein
MDNSKYITLDQDIINLKNRLICLEKIIIVEAFQKYGKFAPAYTMAFDYGNQKEARRVVRRTLRNAVRNLKTINHKVHKSDRTDDIDLIKLINLSIRVLKIQQLFL